MSEQLGGFPLFNIEDSAVLPASEACKAMGDIWTPKQLKALCAKRKGPGFFQVGSRTLYKASELKEWFTAQLEQSYKPADRPVSEERRKQGKHMAKAAAKPKSAPKKQAKQKVAETVDDLA